MFFSAIVRPRAQYALLLMVGVSFFSVRCPLPLTGVVAFVCACVAQVLVLVEAVVGRLRDVDNDVLHGAYNVLNGLPAMFGDDTLHACISNLSEAMQDLYDSVMNLPRTAGGEVAPHGTGTGTGEHHRGDNSAAQSRPRTSSAGR